MSDQIIYGIAVVRHVESGACISGLGKAVLASDEEQTLWDSTWRRCRPGTFECMSPEHDEKGHGPEERWAKLYRHHNGKHFAAHWSGSRGHRLWVGEQEKHNRFKDHVAELSDGFGYPTAKELAIRGERGRRLRVPDVTIRGPGATIGAECQISALAPDLAVRRTADARRAGITSIWMAPGRQPSFAYRVPHVETNELPEVLRRRSLTVVTGPRKLLILRCTVNNFPQCPIERRNWCNRWHPKAEPLRGLTLDDVIEQAPAGQLVPLTLGNATFLVTAQDHEKVMELLGDAETKARPKPPSPTTVYPHRDTKRRPSMPTLAHVAPATTPANCQKCGRQMLTARAVCELCHVTSLGPRWRSWTTVERRNTA